MSHRVTLSSWPVPGLLLLHLGACAAPQSVVHVGNELDVAPPAAQGPSAIIPLNSSQIPPLHTELLPIDLPTAVRVALAGNLDIRQARQIVEASRGRYESAVGSAFPVIAPMALFEHVEGSVRATEGNLVGVGFNTFQVSVALQWVINPGKVVYEIVAARKRLAATEDAAQAATDDTLRLAAVQFYDLVLAQTEVSTTQQGVAEAEEFLRVSRLKLQAGTGVPADERRAAARLAERRQDLISALKGFYDASVALALTLHLDSRVTLVPNLTEITPHQLVRDDLGLDELVEIATLHRPELSAVRKLVEAAQADRRQTWWTNWGPTLSAAYQYGGITGHANNVVAAEGIPGNFVLNPASPTGAFSPNPFLNGLAKESIIRTSKLLEGRDDRTFGFSDQQRAGAGANWRLSLAAFGEQKVANAAARRAVLEAIRALDQVTADVVRAARASVANLQLIDLSLQQTEAAEESLRLAQANFSVGTATALDVLQAQDAASQARLRAARAVVAYNQSQVQLLAALGAVSHASWATPDAVDPSQPPPGP